MKLIESNQPIKNVSEVILSMAKEFSQSLSFYWNWLLISGVSENDLNVVIEKDNLLTQSVLKDELFIIDEVKSFPISAFANRVGKIGKFHQDLRGIFSKVEVTFNLDKNIQLPGMVLNEYWVSVKKGTPNLFPTSINFTASFTCGEACYIIACAYMANMQYDDEELMVLKLFQHYQHLCVLDDTDNLTSSDHGWIGLRDFYHHVFKLVAEQYLKDKSLRVQEDYS